MFTDDNQQKPERLPMLLTVERAAEQLSISISTLYVLFERGEIKPVKIGRGCRVRTRDLERLVRRSRVNARPKVSELRAAAMTESTGMVPTEGQ
jgi:excisionase family DNA binding protein